MLSQKTIYFHLNPKQILTFSGFWKNTIKTILASLIICYFLYCRYKNHQELYQPSTYKIKFYATKTLPETRLMFFRNVLLFYFEKNINHVLVLKVKPLKLYGWNLTLNDEVVILKQTEKSFILPKHEFFIEDLKFTSAAHG